MHILKSGVFSAALLMAASVSAFAQSETLAALPPGAQAAPPAATAPIGPTLSVDAPFAQQPRDVWSDMAKTQIPAPSLGPSPNSNLGSDSD